MLFELFKAFDKPDSSHKSDFILRKDLFFSTFPNKSTMVCTSQFLIYAKATKTSYRYVYQDEIEAYKSPAFTLYKLPVNPPSQEMCAAVQ